MTIIYLSIDLYTSIRRLTTDYYRLLLCSLNTPGLLGLLWTVATGWWSPLVGTGRFDMVLIETSTSMIGRYLFGGGLSHIDSPKLSTWMKKNCQRRGNLRAMTLDLNMLWVLYDNKSLYRLPRRPSRKWKQTHRPFLSQLQSTMIYMWNLNFKQYCNNPTFVCNVQPQRHTWIS